MLDYLKNIYYVLWSDYVIAPVHAGLMRHFKEHFSLRPGARVLDVGCAIGYYRPLFQEYHYCGMDVEHARLRYANKKSNSWLVCQSAEALGFKEETFDLVFCANVVHHLNDATLVKMLSQIKHILKPEGQAVIYDVYRQPGQNFLMRMSYALDFGDYIRPLKPIQDIFHTSPLDCKMQFFKNCIYDYYCARFYKGSVPKNAVSAEKEKAISSSSTLR